MAFFPPALGILRTVAFAPLKFIAPPSRGFSLFTLFNKYFAKEAFQGPVKMKYLAEKELENLCKRNFERKLEELAKKSKETAMKSSSSPLKKSES